MSMMVQSGRFGATVPPGSAWAEVPDSPQGVGTPGDVAATRLTVFWKRATASEVAPAISDSGDHTSKVMLAFRGCPTSGSPFDATAGSVNAGPATAISCPSVTTSEANCMILAATAIGFDTTGTTGTTGWANANLTGVAERVDFVSSTGNGGGASAATGVKATAGATGATTASFFTNTQFAQMTMALKGIGGVAPTFVAAGTANSSSGASTVALPAGIQENDILIVLAETSNDDVVVS